MPPWGYKEPFLQNWNVAVIETEMTKIRAFELGSTISETLTKQYSKRKCKFGINETAFRAPWALLHPPMIYRMHQVFHILCQIYLSPCPVTNAIALKVGSM